MILQIKERIIDPNKMMFMLIFDKTSKKKTQELIKRSKKNIESDIVGIIIKNVDYFDNLIKVKVREDNKDIIYLCIHDEIYIHLYGKDMFNIVNMDKDCFKYCSFPEEIEETVVNEFIRD